MAPQIGHCLGSQTTGVIANRTRLHHTMTSEDYPLFSTRF